MDGEKKDRGMELEEKIMMVSAGETDVDKVWGLIKASADWLNDSKGLDHWLSYYTREVIEKKIKKQEVYLAYQGKDLVGTVSLDTKPVDYYTQEDMRCFEDPNATALYISALTVKPEFQGNGIAGKLMGTIDEIAKKRGIDYVRFDCREEYKELVGFYLKRGYKKVGSYSEGEGQNYLLMEKKVGS